MPTRWTRSDMTGEIGDDFSMICTARDRDGDQFQAFAHIGAGHFRVRRRNTRDLQPTPMGFKRFRQLNHDTFSVQTAMLLVTFCTGPLLHAAPYGGLSPQVSGPSAATGCWPAVGRGQRPCFSGYHPLGVARLRRNIDQSDHVLANPIMSH